MKKTILIVVLVSVVGITFAFFIAKYAVFSVIQGDNLFQATQTKNHERMTQLLAGGADPNFLFDGTTPPLQEAIDNGDAKAAAILVCAGASFEALDVHFQNLAAKPPFANNFKKDLMAQCQREP